MIINFFNQKNGEHICSCEGDIPILHNVVTIRDFRQGKGLKTNRYIATKYGAYITHLADVSSHETTTGYPLASIEVYLKEIK